MFSSTYATFDSVFCYCINWLAWPDPIMLLKAAHQETIRAMLLQQELINAVVLKAANNTENDALAFFLYDHMVKCRKLQGVIARKYLAAPS